MVVFDGYSMLTLHEFGQRTHRHAWQPQLPTYIYLDVKHNDLTRTSQYINSTECYSKSLYTVTRCVF